MNRSARVPAVIVGLDGLTGLQSARILRRRRVPVIGLAQDSSHFCCRTKACDRTLTSDTSGEALVETLVRLADELDGPAVLFPCTDASVLTLARRQQDLPPGYIHDLPDPNTVETLLDKWHFYRYVQREQLPLTGTAFIQERRDAERGAREIRFPAILKPAVKTPVWLSQTSAKVFKIEDGAELLRYFERCIRWSDRLILQEWVPGGDQNLYTSNCYFDSRSEMLVGFVSRKVRQWPLETGSGCLARAEPDQTVLEHSRRLFQGLHFRGLGYLEMKRHPETGQYLIIESNIGRPTGRSSLAEACGVELLYTKYCDNLGLPLPVSRSQTGQKCAWIHLRQDFQASLLLWRRGRLGIREWLRSLRGPKIYALESLSDPAPFLFDLLRVARLAVARLMGRGAES